MFLLRDISIHYELKFMAMVSTSQLFVLNQSNQLSWRIQFLRNSARHVEIFNKHSHSEIYLLGCTFGVGTSWKSCFIAYSQNGNTCTSFLHVNTCMSLQISLTVKTFLTIVTLILLLVFLLNMSLQVLCM